MPERGQRVPAETGVSTLGHGFALRATAPGRWRLEAPFAPDGWVARQPVSAARPAFPGTALMLGDRWLEIVDAEPSGGPRMVYTLAPWHEAEVFRGTAELTPAACARLAQDHRDRQIREARAHRLMLFAPLVGLLPGEDQQRLEREVGIIATRVTALSASVVLGLAMVAAVIGFAASRGVHFGGWQPFARALAPWWFVFVFLALESVIRLRVAWSADMPMGVAAIAGPLGLFRGLARGLAPAPAVVAQAPPGDPAWARARDTVHVLPDGRVEIDSRLPKDHWTLGRTGIAFEGRVYTLTARDIAETKAGRRHHFVLTPLPDDVVPSAHVDYRPEEVRDLFREQQRVRTAMWIESVPFLWGLQPESLQRDLADAYRYDPAYWTRFTIVATTVLGGVNLVGPWWRDDPGLLDLLAVVFGVFVLWETVLRVRALGAGDLRGSVFGLPFAAAGRRALRWTPPPTVAPPPTIDD